MALIKCAQCGKDVSDQAVQCPNCGFRVKDEIKKKKLTSPQICPECGNESAYDATICSNCGHPLKSNTKNRIDNLNLKFWENSKTIKTKAVIIIAAMLIGIFIIAILYVTNPKNNKELPFSNLEYGMSKKEARLAIKKVQNIYGSENSDLVDIYFYGQEAVVGLWYSDDGLLYRADVDIDVSSDTEKANKIISYIQKEYGEMYVHGTWLRIDLLNGDTMDVFIEDDQISLLWWPEDTIED